MTDDFHIHDQLCMSPGKPHSRSGGSSLDLPSSIVARAVPNTGEFVSLGGYAVGKI